MMPNRNLGRLGFSLRVSGLQKTGSVYLQKYLTSLRFRSVISRDFWESSGMGWCYHIILRWKRNSYLTREAAVAGEAATNAGGNASVAADAALSAAKAAGAPPAQQVLSAAAATAAAAAKANSGDAKKASEDAAAAASHIAKETNLKLGDTLNDLYWDVLSSMWHLGHLFLELNKSLVRTNQTNPKT